MAQRIKGQETVVRILKDGAPLANLSAVKSLTIEPQFEILTEQYLGETSSRKDTVQNGVQVKVQFHHDHPEVLDLIQAISDKAQRRVPGIRIDIVTTLRFPSGKVARVSIPECESGPTPMAVAGKNSYVQTDFTFEAAGFRFLQVA